MEKAEVMERVVKILTPWAKNEEALAGVAMETSILDDLKVNSARLVDVVIAFEDDFVPTDMGHEEPIAVLVFVGEARDAPRELTKAGRDAVFRALVEQELGLDPFGPQLFVFCNRQRDKIKILYWERSGFVLWYKRLEKQKFPWPRRDRDGVLQMTGRELNWLLDGIDLFRVQPHKDLSYERVA